MSDCRACTRPTDLFLCTDCETQLADMLDQLPWLLDELDARIQKLDHTNTGTIGRNRRPNELNIIDFDAAETARNIRKDLLKWVETIAQQHTGRKPPTLNTVTTKNLARWLHTNTHAITRLPLAGDLYRWTNRLVGSDQQGGQLIKTINPTERHFAGLCPTTRGHDPDGTPIECGQTLYADTNEPTIQCPTCHQHIDVEQNRRQAAASRDLRTAPEILELLTNLDETIESKQLDAWIQARRLKLKGWRHNNAIVETRVNQHSEPVYSLQRARKLRRRDQQLVKIRAKVKAT